MTVQIFTSQSSSVNMSPVVLINSTIASNSSSWEQIGWQRTLPDNSCNKTTRPFTNGVTNTKYFKQRALYRNLTFWRRQNFKPQPHDWEIEHVMLKKAKETVKQIMPYPLERNFVSFDFKWPSWFDNVLLKFDVPWRFDNILWIEVHFGHCHWPCVQQHHEDIWHPLLEQ